MGASETHHADSQDGPQTGLLFSEVAAADPAPNAGASLSVSVGGHVGHHGGVAAETEFFGC